MKTVAELAKELNTSVQTIYRTLNAVKQNETESLTEKIKGVSYFTAFGEQLIRERLTPVKQDEGECLTEFNSVKQGENEEILFLREQNKALLTELEREREHNRTALEREREHSRTQADKLANLAEQLAELSRNNQILLGAEQSRTNPALLMGGNEAEQDEAPPLKKKSFWSLFKKS